MTPTTGRPITADDLVRVRWPMEPALSPDGRRLAFVVSGLDLEADRLVYQLHLRDLATQDAVPVGGTAAARRPRWSPSGSHLAFLSGAPGSAQVRVLDARGEACWTSSVPGDVTGLDWAPDGRRLACAVSEAAPLDEPQMPYRVGSSPRPGDARRGIWLVSEDAPHGTRLLPSAPGAASAPAWSPTGTAMAFLRDPDPALPSATGSELWLVDAQGAQPRCLVPGQGPITALAWSPDGERIAYVGHTHGAMPGANHELWIVEVETGVSRSISAAVDRSIGQAVRGDDERALGPPDLAWTPDGQRVLAIFADGGRSGIGWFALDGATGMVAAGDRAVLEFDVARDEGSIAFSWSDPWNPGELSLGHLDGRTDRPCTAINEQWRSTVALAPTRAVRHTAEDGASVEGWLVEPVGTGDGPVPLVIEVHGGPHYPIGWRFSLNAQRLAAQGWAMLRANPRGSQGYGAAYATAIHGDWGGQDLRDLLGLMDATLGVAAIDPARVAITGESYGGFLADWAITQTDRFAAAVSENGICDLFAAAARPAMMSFWHAQMSGAPWDRRDLYVQRSPIMHAHAIHTPLLLLESECDPGSQSEELFLALTQMGRDVELVRTPGEGHWVNLFGLPSRRLEKARIVDRWLAQHLVDPAAAAPPPGTPAPTPQEEINHVR